MPYKFYTYLTILLLSSFCSCIEEYQPNISSEESDLYVIEGKITNEGGFHSIFVSKSSDPEDPDHIPVSNCKIAVYDDNDNYFEAEEYNGGEYRVYIDDSYLAIGTAFKAEITTPEGDVIISSYDTLRYCPPIDSIYYEIQNFLTTDPEVSIPGIQFYIDYNGIGSNTKRIKIDIEETWKIESKYPIRWIWDGRVLETFTPPDYSKKVCWKTSSGNNIYVLSTERMTDNKYLKYPLHNIMNTSVKLFNGYSLLISQSSISESTYRYFEKIHANIITEGGLYDTQPQLIEGNFINLSDQNKRVLGNFYVSSVSSKRIFFTHIPDFDLNIKPICEPAILDYGFYFIRGIDKPIYLWLDGGTFRLSDACVDCTSLGGTTIKPDFWPN